MSLFPTTFTQSRTTPLVYHATTPNDTSTSTSTNPTQLAHLAYTTALSLLHDHSALITLNPVVISHTALPPGQSSGLDVALSLSRFSPTPTTVDDDRGWQHYKITDRLPLPFLSLFSSSATKDMTYSTAMKDTDTGIKSLVEAPANVALYATWDVRQPQGDGSVGLLEVVEVTHVRCSALLAWYVRGDLERSHARLHERMSEVWKERMRAQLEG